MSFLHCISVLKIVLINLCKIKSLDLLPLVVFISFYISGYHFHQFLELHSKLTEKKICPEFSFLNGFTEPLLLLQRPKYTQRDKSFLLMLPLSRVESQTAKFHGREANFKILALAFSQIGLQLDLYLWLCIAIIYMSSQLAELAAHILSIYSQLATYS